MSTGVTTQVKCSGVVSGHTTVYSQKYGLLSVGGSERTYEDNASFDTMVVQKYRNVATWQITDDRSAWWKTAPSFGKLNGVFLHCPTLVF